MIISNWEKKRWLIQQICLHFKATGFYFSVLDQKKSKIYWGRAVKKHLEKTNIPPIFRKVNEGDQIKKNIGQISGNVNEGDEIKKLTYFK